MMHLSSSIRLTRGHFKREATGLVDKQPPDNRAWNSQQRDQATTLESPPSGLARTAIVTCAAIAAIATHSVSHPMMVPRNAVGNSSVTAKVVATKVPRPAAENQVYATNNHSVGHAKFDGGPQ